MTLLRPQSKGWQTQAANCCLAWETDLRTAADALVEAQVAYVRGDVGQGLAIVHGVQHLVRAPMTVIHRELKKEDRADKARERRANREIERNRLRVLGPKFKTKIHRGKLVELTGVQFRSRKSGEVFYADIWEGGKITGTTTVSMYHAQETDDEFIKKHYGRKPAWLK